MSRSINQKRQNYRKQIVKKEKQTYFMEKRKQILQSQSLKEQNQMVNPVLMLKERHNTISAFEIILARINCANYVHETLKLTDDCLINVLMNYIHERTNLLEVFEIIDSLLEKKQFNFFMRFYNSGILEYLVSYIGISEISHYCAYILLKFTDKSDDYSEALLYSKSYQILIKQFMRRVQTSKNAHEENQALGNRFFSSILLILDNLIRSNKSTLDFVDEKMEIYNFSILLINQRLFIKLSLGIIYECYYQMQINRISDCLPLISQLLGQVRTDDNYLYNLLAITYLFSPFQLDFDSLFRVGVMAKKVQRPFLRILQKLMERPDLKQKIPKDELWWERLLVDPENSQFLMLMIRFIHRLEIKKEWVWRVLGTSLQCQNSKVKNEVLVIIDMKLRENKQSNLIDILYKNRIPQILESLTNDKNSQVASSSQDILEYILGTLTKNSAQMMI